MFWKRADSVKTTKSGIRVENVRADIPQFKRIYSARLDARATVTVTIRTFIGSRSKSGELTQPNGRWVRFDPDAVAEKILDPKLVPLIQRCVDEIDELDRDYIRSNPDEFIDESGQKWKRAEE